jgi:hypothetical protein
MNPLPEATSTSTAQHSAAIMPARAPVNPLGNRLSPAMAALDRLGLWLFAKEVGHFSQQSERIFWALDIRPAGAAFLENAGWNYFVFTKTLV